MRRAADQLDAVVAAQERAGAELNASLRALAGMTDAERAELRFALRCDPEVRAIVDDAAKRVPPK